MLLLRCRSVLKRQEAKWTTDAGAGAHEVRGTF